MATGLTRYGGRLLEVPALRKTGDALSIAFTVTLLFDGSTERPYAIAAVVRDDTERWRERRRLRAGATSEAQAVQAPQTARADVR